MRDTELGALPAEWEISTIANIVERANGSVQTGPFGSQLHASDYVVDGVPFIMPKDLSASGKILTDTIARVGKKDYERLARYHLQEGDLLVGRRGEMGRRGLVTSTESGWVCGSGCLRIRAGALIDPNFFSFAFETPIVREWLEANAIGTTMKNLSAEIVSRLPMILPPIPEQHAIARVLSTIQRAIETQDDLITAARELKKSLMRQLFTRGLDANGAVKETEIGVMPEHWELVKLESVFESRLGKMLSGASRKGVSPRPYVRNANVQWGKVDVTDLAQMDFSEDERKEFRLKSGDILICEGGEIGRTAIWHDEIGECYFQKAIHRLRPINEKYNRKFFLYHMTYAFLIAGSYGMIGTKTTIAHLPGVKLKALKIPFPPLSEQREIARILATVDKKIENEEERKAALEALFKTMLQQLMTGQIRVTDSSS